MRLFAIGLIVRVNKIVKLSIYLCSLNLDGSLLEEGKAILSNFTEKNIVASVEGANMCIKMYA